MSYKKSDFVFQPAQIGPGWDVTYTERILFWKVARTATIYEKWVTDSVRLDPNPPQKHMAYLADSIKFATGDREAIRKWFRPGVSPK